MPLNSFACQLCGARCPKEYLAEGRFKDRMAWLRRHRKRKHPTAHKRSVKKAQETKAKGVTMPKKKRTAKQIAASKRNIKKAQAARRKKGRKRGRKR